MICFVSVFGEVVGVVVLGVAGGAGLAAFDVHAANETAVTRVIAMTRRRRLLRLPVGKGWLVTSLVRVDSDVALYCSPGCN